MKTSALAFAVLASVAAADTCDYAVVGPQLQTLGTEIAECTTATGYNVANTTATPTATQKAALCTECTAFVTKVSAMTWPDCTMELAGVNQTLTQYFDNMIGQCLTTSSSSSGSSSSANSSDAEVSTDSTSAASDASIAAPLSAAIAAAVFVAAFLF